ncbi:bifunctional nuclease family protein [Citrifermentans bremense]|nr:bifunctional nuclease family protein [Citrifermentans bremense]
MTETKMGETKMYLEMKVFGFALDAIAQMPVIILKDAEEKHAVPVWINAQDSVAFAAQFVGREATARTRRKDVFTALVEQMELTLSRIVVESLKDGVFIASVRLVPRKGEEIRLEVHVTEAMLLSLRYQQPVLVDPEVLAQVSTLDLKEDGLAEENNARRFVDFLDHMDPAAMGKYPM